MNCVMCSNGDYKITTTSPDDTYKLGKVLGHSCYAGLTILLNGGLGMGKTCITQGIGAALNIKRIKSPTFIIVSEHEGKIPLAHADLYRLESFSDVDSLDLESFTEMGGVLVVEWAERWQNPPSEDLWSIAITEAENNVESREIDISALGVRAKTALIEALNSNFN